MSKPFVLATVTSYGQNQKWMVKASNSREIEEYVSKAGAIGYLESVLSSYSPVLALIYRPGTNDLVEAWFYEKRGTGEKRKLNVMLVTERKGN